MGRMAGWMMWMRGGSFVVMLAACGPTAGGSGGEGSGGSEGGSDDETSIGDGVPQLVWERVPTMCGRPEVVLPTDELTFVVAGSEAIVSGWLTRFDADGNELWSVDAAEPISDLDVAPDGGLWAVSNSTIAGYDLEGAPTGAPPKLGLAADVDLSAVARAGATWWIGGRVGDAPTDAFLAGIDASGEIVEAVDAPAGDGAVGSWIRAIDRSDAVVAACGEVGESEWSSPWLRIDDGTNAYVVGGVQPSQLDTRACVDVAVGDGRVARCESGQPAIVVTDVRGEEAWRVATEGARPAALVYLSDGDLVVAAKSESRAGGEEGWLRRISVDGETRWSIPLPDPELSVGDLAITDDGALILVGNTTGAVGECDVAWVGRYEFPEE
jgi:hypothetical protein